MFFYLYDTFVLDKNNASTLDKVESRVIELGINGRVEKLKPLRNMKDLIENGIKNDAHTIVVVGNDQSFLRAMQVVAQHTDCVIGYIPIITSPLSELLGIPNAMEACDSLSRSITKSIALGKVNQTYSLRTLTAQLPPQTKLHCNAGWGIVTQTVQTQLTIERHGEQLKIDLQPEGQPAGFLRKPKLMHPTNLSVSKLTITHPDLPISVLLDGTTALNCPVTCSTKSKALKVIVGKQRLI